MVQFCETKLSKSVGNKKNTDVVLSVQGDLVVRLGAGDLSLYDGDVNHSLSRHRHTNCDDPGEHMTFWHVTS